MVIAIRHDGTFDVARDRGGLRSGDCVEFGPAVLYLVGGAEVARRCRDKALEDYTVADLEEALGRYELAVGAGRTR